MMSPTSSQLPIDECEEWIWNVLDCNKDCGFEYITGEGKEFDFYADTRALYKIRRLTGMRLVQMSTHNGSIQLAGFFAQILPHEDSRFKCKVM
jgi:hypothetical protein